MKYSDSDIPFHVKLRDEIEKDILSGKYKPGELIPSENDFASRKGISRPTVRQAFSELVSKGLLTKIKGKGTFVSDFRSVDVFDHTKGFIHTLLDCNDNTSRKINSIYQVDGNEYSGTRKLSEIFGVDPSQGYSSRFIKVEYVFDDTNVYCESYLPLMYFPEATALLEKNARSHELLSGKIPLEPRSAKCQVTLSTAGSKAAQALELSPGSEVLFMESTLVNGRGSIVEYNTSCYKPRNTRIVFTKIRNI